MVNKRKGNNLKNFYQDTAKHQKELKQQVKIKKSKSPQQLLKRGI